MKTNQATHKRERLQYARFLVEVVVNQVFPEHIYFVNERDVKKQVKVVYEWKPEVCAICQQFGHNAGQCRRQVGRKVWKEKEKHQNPLVSSNNLHQNVPEQRQVVDKEGF